MLLEMKPATLAPFVCQYHVCIPMLVFTTVSHSQVFVKAGEERFLAHLEHRDAAGNGSCSNGYERSNQGGQAGGEDLQ